MKYMGSKRRIAKSILPIMLQDRGNRPWIEPFVGGGNVIERVNGIRIGYDINSNVIQALEIIRDRAQDLPRNNTEFTEEDYKQLRYSDSCWFKPFAGYAYSFGGKWMAGWSRNKRHSDYVRESYNSAIYQQPLLQGVQLYTLAYDAIAFEDLSVIYCDPPYTQTTQYKTMFDHDHFWQWCRERSQEGHYLFVSEYRAPNDFECIWSGKIPSSLTLDTGSKYAIEKLFRYKG